MGRAKAPVLPLPVSARPMMSRPCRGDSMGSSRIGCQGNLPQSWLGIFWWLRAYSEKYDLVSDYETLKKKTKHVKNVPNHQPDMENRENLINSG